jgi:antitoxin component YwqK of YwqJK toxin-antitoxin module
MRVPLTLALCLVSATLETACASRPGVVLACPEGTRLRRDGPEAWCETPEGVSQGPTWTSFEDGSLASYGTMVDGLLEGEWRQWHRDGTPAYEARFSGGELVGPFRRWDASGHLIYEGRHDARGRMHGTWRRWWPGGPLRLEWVMVHGLHEGLVRGFHPDGRRRLEGAYHEGRRAGLWIHWDPDGRVSRRCRYALGRPIEGECDPPAPDAAASDATP